MKTSKFLKNKISKPATQVAASLIIVTVASTMPNLSLSTCPSGNLGDCDQMPDGSYDCTVGGWFDDCGNGKGISPTRVN